MPSLKWTVWVGIVLSVTTAQGASSSSGSAQKLDDLAKKWTKNGAKLSIQVDSLTQGKTLYTYHADQALAPASIVKLLTAYVALKKLGPEYTFKTRVWHQGVLGSDGTLKGDLWVEGGGDPALVTERLYLLVAELKRKGLKKVTGNLYWDASVFDEEWIPEERTDQNSPRAYAAPISGLNLNYNSLAFYVRPGLIPGARAEVAFEPANPYVRLLSEVKTARSGKGTQVSFERSVLEKGKSNRFRWTGSISQGSKEYRKYLSITHPPRYFMASFCALMTEQGIEAKCDSIMEKKKPSSLTLFGELESQPLREIVTLMNKYSNNFIADALVKAVGREMTGNPGSMASGLKVMATELQNLGLSKSAISGVVSGSGLTHSNRLSSADFVLALRKIAEDFEVYPEFLVSLPIAGRDGTLRSQWKKAPLLGKVRAKTGSLRGVKSLAGYMTTRTGELLAFSLIVNGTNAFPEEQFGEMLWEFQEKKEERSAWLGIDSLVKQPWGGS